jgi:REP element-mobilizing transposase RayT
VARTAAFAVRVFSQATIAAVPYSIAVSKLRRPFLSDFFIAVRLLKRRERFTEPDFALLARAFNRGRALHPFYLTAWVFLPDHWHSICAPVHPTTISLAMESVARTAVFAVCGSSFEKAADHRSGGPRYQLWQPRFFDRALRTVKEYKEYKEKVEYIHLNPVRAGLASRPEDWRWSSYNVYAGIGAEEQKKHCSLIVDRVRIPSDPRTRI